MRAAAAAARTAAVTAATVAAAMAAMRTVATTFRRPILRSHQLSGQLYAPRKVDSSSSQKNSDAPTGSPGSWRAHAPRAKASTEHSRTQALDLLDRTNARKLWIFYALSI